MGSVELSHPQCEAHKCFFPINDAHNCDIRTQMALSIEHAMNVCLTSSSTILQRKHEPSTMCLRFKAITKGNPPTIAC